MNRLLLSSLFIFWLSSNNSIASEAAITAAQHAKVEPMPVAAVFTLQRQLRAMQLVQDRMAEGNERAMDAQGVLLLQMLNEMEDGAGFGALNERQTVFILGIALLNGADPERIRAVLGQNAIYSKDPFFLGALAYAEGRVAESLAAFETIDVLKLPRTVQAQFHLTVGVLLASTKPEQAAKSFTAARLMAPGTLIEEAGLRREALLEMGNPNRFLVLLKSYLHRFKNSPFASSFISQFAFSISDLEADAQTEITAELDAVLAGARKEDRQNFYAILARSSLIGGQNVLTEFATSQALREVSDPSVLLSARLYHAAFHVAGKNYKQAANELHSLMRVPLQPADQEILKAAIGVAKELRRWPFDEEGEKPALKNVKLQPRQQLVSENSVTVLTAKKLIEETRTFVTGQP